jgi:hypothetical protein
MRPCSRSQCWHDTGSTSWEGDNSEAYAEFFAFMSVVDPNAGNRPQWAMRVRALLMWVMNQAALGHASGQPFRDPEFMYGDRANTYGEDWGLTVDWLYPYLTTAEKATIRKAFLLWANDLMNAPNRSGQPPYLPGSNNYPQVLGNDPSATAFQQQQQQLQLRWLANNYGIGETRTLTMIALALAPADDPPVDPAKPAGQIGNTVRSYVTEVTG